MLGKYGPMDPAELSDELKKHAADNVTFSAADTEAEKTSNHLHSRLW
jgi:hypothetical protein